MSLEINKGLSTVPQIEVQERKIGRPTAPLISIKIWDVRLAICKIRVAASQDLSEIPGADLWPRLGSSGRAGATMGGGGVLPSSSDKAPRCHRDRSRRPLRTREAERKKENPRSDLSPTKAMSSEYMARRKSETNPEAQEQILTISSSKNSHVKRPVLHEK